MIYGVSPIMQSDLVKRFCFGTCGKIQCDGAYGGKNVGPVFLCKQRKCRYEDTCSPVLGMMQGEDFVVRKLKEAEDE